MVMTDMSVETVGEVPPHGNEGKMIGETGNLDEEGEWGDEDEGFPLGSETNDGEEDEVGTEVSKSNKGSSSRSETGVSSSSSSKSHHKSGSERRRKHHHRHHHSSGGGSSSSSSRSEKRRKRSATAAAPGSTSLADIREESSERDHDGRDALSSRLSQLEEDGADGPRRGSSTRRRSDSLGDKSGHHHDQNQAPGGSGSSPRKLSGTHDHHSSNRRGSRVSAEAELSPQSHSRHRRDSPEYGEAGGGGDSRHRRRDARESRGRRGGGERSSRGGGGETAKEDDEAEDGEILEDGELDDDDYADGEERNDRSDKEGASSKFSRSSGDKYGKYSPSDRKRSSADYRDRWKRDSDEKKRKKKLYGDAGEDDEEEDMQVRSSSSPPSGSGALPAWGSGVSQAASTKASANSGSAGAAGAGYRGKQSQGGRYGKSGGHGGQSPPGLYDSPSYSEDSDDGMMPDGYMDADEKEYENMRLKRAKKRGRDALGDGRKRGGPPRKKTLMEMAMSERPICKFYMDGKCAKGSGCQFNHDIESPRPKMEVCKYHLTVKGCHKEHCLYMHENYPCKYYHTGAKCFSGDRCKFSHAPLTEETRRALALRVAAEDIIDMEDPEYRDYRDYPSRDYDDSERDYEQDDYNDNQEYSDMRNRPSLLGSPPRAKKIPSLFEIKVTPPGQSPKAGSVTQAGRQAGFHSEANPNVAPGGLNKNANMGAMGGGVLTGNMNMNQQQQQHQQQQQIGLRQGLGLLGPGGPLPARGPNAAMIMGMQQQQQQLVRPGFGLAGAAPFVGQGNNMNNLQQQRNLGVGNVNGGNNNGNLPPVLNMLGSLIRDLQNGPGTIPTSGMGNMAGNMGVMPGQNNMGNMGQNNMGNMGHNSMANMGNMPSNSMSNMAQNNIGNMGQNNMGNMAQSNMGNNGMAMGAGNNMAMRAGLNMNNNNMANMAMNNAMNMVQRQPNANSMGPGVMRPPMPGAPGMQQIGMNNGSNNGNVMNGMGNIPVSGANMFNNNNNNLSGGGFNPSGTIGNVSNPGQEVGIMDVDYRVGQQQPQGPPTAVSDDTSGKTKDGKGMAEEEDSSQDLGELDKMRRQIEEQIRAEDERAAAEAADLEDEALGESGQNANGGTSEEKSSARKNEEDTLDEDSTKDSGKAPEAVVEIPAHLPRKQRELLKRIQQQEISRQREKERQEAAEKAEAEARAVQEAQAKAEVDDFYSSEEEGDNGEKQPKLTDVLKKLNEETPSASTTSTNVSAPATTSTSAPDSSTTTTANSTVPSTFNIMQMIQAIKSKTGGSSVREQSSDAQQTSSDSKRPVLPSPESPPASPTDKDQASIGLGLRLQPLTVDPPVVSARPLRPLTYSVVKLSLSQARPYSQLPAGVTLSDSKYRSDPRVKWHAQYMERQLKKKASAGAGGEGVVPEVSTDSKRKTSVDEDTIASPTQDNSQKPSVAPDPRLKKADPRLQKAGASPNSSGSPGAAKAVDPRLEKAANRPTDPRLAARALDPRLNRQNSLPPTVQGGFSNQMGGMQMGGAMNNMGGPGMNAVAGNMNPMTGGMNNQMGAGLLGNPQMNMAMQSQMGGFRNNQMGAGGPMGNQMGGAGGQMGMGMGMNNQIGGAIGNGPRGGPMNMGNNNMMMAAGMNRMGPGTGGVHMNMGMGSVGPMGNQGGGPMNSMGMRPQMQGGIFVSGGGDMSTIGQAARGGVPGQMMNQTSNMPGGHQGFTQQGPRDPASANSDPRLGGMPHSSASTTMHNDPRLKNRAMDPRDPRDLRGAPDPRDPRAAGFSYVKDPRSRDPRGARQFADNSDVATDMGLPNLSERNERFGSSNSGGFGSNINRVGWPSDEDKDSGASVSESGISSGLNNPPSVPASLSQPPLSSLPPSLSLTTSSFSSSSSSISQTATSSSSEKPSGVSTTFDHRNDPRFKRVKRSAGPRAASMNYSSPLGGDQEGSVETSVSAASDSPSYNSYNRPKPAVPRLERNRDTPSPSLPDTLEDFDMPETVEAADIKVKDIFKSIDPTASPFC